MGDAEAGDDCSGGNCFAYAIQRWYDIDPEVLCNHAFDCHTLRYEIEWCDCHSCSGSLFYSADVSFYVGDMFIRGDSVEVDTYGVK